MSFFDHPEFDHHEQVCYFSDQQTGLKAIIAIHDTSLGPALGGTRFFPYLNDEDALSDVLRLSKGMTYKSAIAQLPLGGGKSVIIGNPKTHKSKALLESFAQCLNHLNGRYIAAEDSGTNVEDMKSIHQFSPFVSGYHDKESTDGGMKSGDPSPATAYGCYLGIKAALQHKLGKGSVNGLTVGIQGLGNVGYRLADRLAQEGANIIVCDINTDLTEKAKNTFGASVVGLEEIYSQPMDIFAPCALGATINKQTAPLLQASIIAGSANNQLDTMETGQWLHEHDICYAPDYVINAGGIIDVYYEQLGQYNAEKVSQHIERIYNTLVTVFQRSEAENIATAQLADTLAIERLHAQTPTS